MRNEDASRSISEAEDEAVEVAAEAEAENDDVGKEEDNSHIGKYAAKYFTKCK